MAETAAAPSLAPPGAPADPWEEAGWLTCELNVAVPVPEFTVRELLRLAIGSIVETQWRNGHDLPLHANQRQIGWVEFEAAGESLAVRITALR